MEVRNLAWALSGLRFKIGTVVVWLRVCDGGVDVNMLTFGAMKNGHTPEASRDWLVLVRRSCNKQEEECFGLIRPCRRAVATFSDGNIF